MSLEIPNSHSRWQELLGRVSQPHTWKAFQSQEDLKLSLPVSHSQLKAGGSFAGSSALFSLFLFCFLWEIQMTAVETEHPKGPHDAAVV